MAKSKPTQPLGATGSAMPAEALAARMAHLRSGAAGVHADQKSRRKAAGGRTNRVGSRSAQRRASVRDFD